MRNTLLTHASRYPLMEPRDAVKLIYQSEFGGGHMIQNEEACLTRLRQEYASVTQNPDTPLLEEIGNGICRVNLAALDRYGYSPDALGRDFIRSAAITAGSINAFQEKLLILQELTDSGAMPFSRDTLDAYLEEYRNAGFPPVSHSASYRAAYRPAYRVVAAACLPADLPKNRT